MKIIRTIAILSCFLLLAHSVSSEVSLPLTYVRVADTTGVSTGNFFFQVSLPITIDASSKVEPNPVYTFAVDNGISQVFHGVKSPNDWGINCSNTDKTNCYYTDLSSTDFFGLYGTGFYFTQATTQFTFSDKKPMLNKPPMNIGLVTIPRSTKSWVYGESGILGLGAQSPFWTYLFEQYYPTATSLTYSHYLKTDSNDFWYQLYEGETDGIFVGSKLRISEDPKELIENGNDLIWAEGLGEGYWGIKDAQLWYQGDLSKPWASGSACFSASSPSTIFTDNNLDYQRIISKTVCGEEDCSDVASRLTWANDLYLTFKDQDGKAQNITITPQQYIYQTKGKGKVPSIDEVGSYAGDACPKDTAFGLGRMFLFHNLVLMKITKDGKQSIGISSYSERPVLAKIIDVKTLVLVGVSIIVGCLIILMILRSGSSAKMIDHKSYQKEKDNSWGDEEKLNDENDEEEKESSMRRN